MPRVLLSSEGRWRIVLDQSNGQEWLKPEPGSVTLKPSFLVCRSLLIRVLPREVVKKNLPMQGVCTGRGTQIEHACLKYIIRLYLHQYGAILRFLHHRVIIITAASCSFSSLSFPN